MKGLFLLSSLSLFLLVSCNSNSDDDGAQNPPDSAFINSLIVNAPELSPEDAIRTMVVEDGFEVRLVAAEPLVSSPVALNFDNRGRIWVVEMEGYMPNAEGTGEDVPNGKIVILEDENKDGAFDKRSVFLDSLVLPRALCLVDDGLLVAEPPYLWYYTIVNDKPVNRVLVDSAYTEGGNVEAQSNGLYRALDNWIYSSGAYKRYRKTDTGWLTENTHLRGQWGISQDDYGRLFYNNNSQNLLGDYFTPSLGASNPNQRRVAGFKEKVVEDRRVFPIRPTPGVNRGYQKNILDDSLRLKNFTAASGPVIYRGDLFGDDYYQNAFVGEPAANLIKRNILKKEDVVISGEPAYEGKEFLASYDERFRPVSLYNGPDGALYIVDMYRGIIQHKLFLTEYLKGEIEGRSLEKPINLGRIYKVVPKGKKVSATTFPTDAEGFVKLLDHKNGWVRDKAQQILVDSRYANVAPLLRNNLSDTKSPLKLIHSLWTLEGLGSLQSGDVLKLLQVKDVNIRSHALTALPAVLSASNYQQFIPAIKTLIEEKDTSLSPYIAFQLHLFDQYDKNVALDLRDEMIKIAGDNNYVVDALISGIAGKEQVSLKRLSGQGYDTSLFYVERLEKVLIDIKNNESNKDINLLRKKYPRGVSLFRSTCQPCHGSDGNGIESLAPPLNNSDWVEGSKNRLIATVLYGLKGPIKVNGKLYDKVNGEMPGIGNNKDLVDEDIAQLLSFIRQYWSNTASEVSRDEVIKIRNKFKDRQEAFTMREVYDI